MKSVSDALIDNFHSGNQKYVTLTFSDETALTNDEIVIESLGIEQTICDESALTFGTVYAGAFSIQIFDRGKNYKGLTVSVNITVEDYSMSLGSYIITSNPVDDNTGYRTLIGYDAMYSVLKTDYSSWHNSLTSSVNTIAAYRNAFFTEIGITQQSTTLVNDAVAYVPMTHEGTLSGADILKAILETNGVMGYLDFDQTFHYVTLRDCTATDEGLYPSLTLYPSSGVYPAGVSGSAVGSGSADEEVLDGSYLLGGLGYEKYQTENYLVVDLFAGQNEYTAGTSGLTYTVQSNILTVNMGSTEATAVAAGILSVIAEVTYTPTSLEMLACPWIELGDVVLVKASDGTLIAFPVLQRKMSGITFLKDTFEALGVETEQNNPNTVKQQIIDAKNFASQYATKYLYETEDGDLIESPTAPTTDDEAAVMSGYYTKIVSSGDDAGFDIYTGDGTSTGQTRVAHYGAEAVIGIDDDAHTTIGSGRMQFDDVSQNLMFMGRINNDTSGYAMCQLTLPIDHAEVQTDGSYVFTETYDMAFPTLAVSSIVGVGFTAADDTAITALTENTHWTVTLTDDLITEVTITATGVSVINDYIANYDPVNVIVVKFLTEESVQAFALEKTSDDYITPDTISIYDTLPGDGSFAITGGKAIGEDSVAMAGGRAMGKRSFAYGYSSESGYCFAKKEGEVRFKSDNFIVQGEMMTFGTEGEVTGWEINSSYIDTSSSNLMVYQLGDYVRIDGSLVTNASVPAGTTLVTGLPKSFFAGGDRGEPRMRFFGRLVCDDVLITGSTGALQAIIYANAWTDAGTITLPGAGTYLVRFNFNMTDNVTTGQMTGRINYGESSSTGIRNRQSIYFSKSNKDLCMTVMAFITVSSSTTVTCQLYSTFASSEPDNAYVNITAFCLNGSYKYPDVAELNIMNASEIDESDTTYKACLATRGSQTIPSGATIRFGTTYIRDSLWDGGYNG